MSGQGAAVLGLFLIVVGALFIVAGLTKLIVETIVQARGPGGAKKGFSLDQATAFINAVAKLPPWAISVVVGLVLIYAGYLVQGRAAAI